MRIIRWLALTSVLVLVGTGVAVARSTTVPKMDKVKATFVISNVEDSETGCQGSDGFYIQADQVWKGPEKSKDPRLIGEVEIDNRVLQNQDTGAAVVTGTATLRGAKGTIKYQGTFTSVAADGLHFKGLLTANVKGGGMLIAPLSSVLDPSTFTISNEFGKDPGLVLGDPAVIQIGSC